MADIQRDEEKSHMCASAYVSIAVNPGSYARLIPASSIHLVSGCPVVRQDRKDPLVSSYSTLASSVPGEW